MTPDSLIIPSSAHWFRENNKRDWLFWFWTKSCACFHCNSRHRLILCLEAIGVKMFLLQIYFLTRVHGKIICCKNKKIWYSLEETETRNTQSHVLAEWGFLSKALYCAKDTFVVCREVVSGTVTLGIPAYYPIIKSSVCRYLNKHSCCFPRNMARSSKEKKGN